MPSYVTPKKNTEFIFYVGIPSQAGNIFQANPTLATGDVKVSTDGGALGNINTLPTVTPTAGKMVKVILSASEMNGDNVTIIFSDVAGDEWNDLVINIQTTVQQIDSLATSSSVSSLNNLSATEVNSEVLDVLTVDTFSLSGKVAPTATPTMKEALLSVYKDWRNKKEVTATEWKLYADDGVTVDQKATISDDMVTTTKEEIGSGA